jgi:hypothetical protein
MRALATFLRWASRLACVIVIVSFAIFAVEKTSEASTHQQNQLKGTSNGSAPPHEAKPSTKKGSVQSTIEDVAGELISPFSGVTTGSSSQWVVRGVGTLLALLVYGLGVGYLARTLRIRV